MAHRTDRIFTRDFTLVSLGTMLYLISFIVFFPTLPIYIQEHGGAPSLIGLIVGSAALASLTLRPFTGLLVDRFGRRRFLILGAVLVLLASAGYDFVTDVGMIWPLRVLAGLGVSAYTTGSLAYVTDIAPSHKRGEAMSYYSSISILALALGPLLGTWLINSDRLWPIEERLRNWLPGAGSDVSGEFNFAILFVVAMFFALLSVLLSQQLKEHYTPAPVEGQSLSERLKGLFNKAAAFPAAINSLTTSNTVALNVFIPIYALEIDMKNVGLFYTVYAVGTMIVRAVAGRMLDTFPRAYVVAPAMLVVMTGTLLIGIIQEPVMVLIGGAINGAGYGLSQPGLQAEVADRAKGERVGSAMATFSLGHDAGLAGGAALMGLVLELTNFTTFFVVSGSLVGLAAALLLGEKALMSRRQLAAA